MTSVRKTAKGNRPDSIGEITSSPRQATCRDYVHRGLEPPAVAIDTHDFLPDLRAPRVCGEGDKHLAAALEVTDALR
jgi:hypothetical protein